MSCVRRERSVSFASAASIRLRSRIVCCESSWFDQKLGSEAFFSTSASCSRSRGASKILPQIVGLRADARVFAFEFFNHHFGFPGLHKRFTGEALVGLAR